MSEARNDLIPRDEPNIFIFGNSAKIKPAKGLLKHPGYCAGISICWILLRRRGGDFDTVQTRDGPGAAPYQKVIFTKEQKGHIQFYQDVRVAAGGYKGLFGKGSLGDAFIIDGPDYSANNFGSLAIHIAASAKKSNSEIIGGVATSFYLVRLEPNDGTSGHVFVIEVKGTATEHQVFRVVEANTGCYEINGLMPFIEWMKNLPIDLRAVLAFYQGSLTVQKVNFPRPSPTNLPGLIFQSGLG